jgi:hypothetical protein
VQAQQLRTFCVLLGCLTFAAAACSYAKDRDGMDVFGLWCAW